MPPKVTSGGFFCPWARPEGCQLPFRSSPLPHKAWPSPSLQMTPPSPGGWRRVSALPISPGHPVSLSQPTVPLPIQVPCPPLAQEHCRPQREAAPTLRKLSDQLPLSGYLIPSSSDQTQTGFFNYSFSISQIAVSSHNLLSTGYKADQIFPLPTAATAETKTKHLACWFPLQLCCLSSLLFL